MKRYTVYNPVIDVRFNYFSKRKALKVRDECNEAEENPLSADDLFTVHHIKTGALVR